MLLKTTSAFTASHNRPHPLQPTCVCERSPQRRILSLSAHPQFPLHNRGSNPAPGNSIKEGVLESLHCLWKASPHHSRSICNTVRGVAHYCLPRFHFVPFVWLTEESSCPAGPVKESPVALKGGGEKKKIEFSRLGIFNTPVQMTQGLIINQRDPQCAIISDAV